MLSTEQMLDKGTLNSLVQTCNALAGQSMWARNNIRSSQRMLAIATDGGFIDTSFFEDLPGDAALDDFSAEGAHAAFLNGINSAISRGIAELIVSELAPISLLAALCFAVLGKTTIIELDDDGGTLKYSSGRGLPPACSDFLKAKDWPSLIFCNCKITGLAIELRSLFPKAHCAETRLSKIRPWFASGALGTRKTPLFSIVVPTLGERELVRCLTSVVTQTFSDYEVLLIKSSSNGVNQSGTPNKKLSQLISLSSHVRQIDAHDSGPYDAMNLGLALARAPWIYFLGASDTLFSRGALMTIARSTTNCPTTTNLIYGTVKMIGKGIGTYDGQIWGEFFTYDRLRVNNVCHQSAFYKTQALRDIGGYDRQFPICADWNANIKLWNRSSPVFINTVVANFQRGGLSTHSEDTAFNVQLEKIWQAHRDTAK